jgi:hypothetical protein
LVGVDVGTRCPLVACDRFAAVPAAIKLARARAGAW